MVKHPPNTTGWSPKKCATATAIAGLMLLPHAWPKFMILGAQGVAANILARRGIEPALPIAYLIMFLELVGAICITIGFLTRPFALLLLIEMLVITAFVVSSYSA